MKAGRKQGGGDGTEQRGSKVAGLQGGRAQHTRHIDHHDDHHTTTTTSARTRYQAALLLAPVVVMLFVRKCKDLLGMNMRSKFSLHLRT